MRIIIFSQYFWPESFKINDLACELKNRKHQVEVLTGKPNYPQGRFYEGYGFWRYTKDYYNGVLIRRVPIIPRGRATGIRLTLNYLSYVFFACLYVLFKRKKYDVAIVFATSPITQALPALLHKKLCGGKTCLWLQDLWPESVVAAGKVKSPVILKCLDNMVKYIYRNLDQIFVQSKAFIPSVKEKGGKDAQIAYIPNWAEDLYNVPVTGIPEKYMEAMPKGFNIVFAGNIGESQDFESILKAVEMTKSYEKINWVIIGDGRKKAWVEEKIKSQGLEKNIYLLRRYPPEEIPYFFSLANIMLLTLKNEEIFSLTIPSKLQSYMAAGKPILSMINGVANQIIQDAGCGYTSGAGDYEGLALNAIKAYQSHPEDLISKGENGKVFYHREFEKQQIIDRLIDAIKTG